MILNKLDLNKLHTFASIYEEKGIAGAADKTLLTRSAISQSLSALEKSIGVSLFQRSGKKLIPTPHAKKLYETLRPYFLTVQSTLGEISAGEELGTGIVRMGVFIGFPREELSDALSTFLKENKNAQVKLLYASPSHLGKLLTSGKIDVALSIHPLEKTHVSIQSRKILSQELVLVATKAFHKNTPSIGDIQKMPLVEYYESSQFMRRWMKHHFKKDPLQLNIRVYAATTDLVLSLVLKGAGAGVLPRHMVEELIQKKLLFQIKTGRPEVKDHIWANELKTIRHGRLTRSLLEKFTNGARPSSQRPVGGNG